jgi:putative solute:sodium symporter small subunit
MPKASSGDRALHWQKTKTLTLITLIIWYFFSFEIHLWGDALNAADFPGGYFMAGLGSQVAFAILVFWFASRQNKIDHEHGLAE